MKIGVVQGGARMHYAVPRIFEEAGILGRLYTDAVGNKGFPRIANKLWPTFLQPSSARSLFGRLPVGIPKDKISAVAWLGVYLAGYTYLSRSLAEVLQKSLRFNDMLGDYVLKHFDATIDSLYIVGPQITLSQEAKRRGVRIIVEQVNAPAEVIVDILGQESTRYPELSQDDYQSPIWNEYIARERAEWNLADQIICGSHFVLDGIKRVGGPAEKVTVVPYGVSKRDFQSCTFRKQGRHQFNILFVGRVDLRKGAHYLIEAARLLEEENFAVHFVGPLHLPESLIKAAPPNVKFLGRVPRVQMAEQYAWADVFCLPSLCEGSATVTYEAMSMGLPVIATHNTGSIVREGENGFIVAIRDPEGIAAAVRKCQERLASDPSFPQNPGSPPPFSFEAYRQRLLEAVSLPDAEASSFRAQQDKD